MCIIFQKTTSESHRSSLKPTPQCPSTERELCSVVCLNVYNVLKNFSRNPLLLLGAHHSLYIHRAHTLFNCMFACVKCFKKLLLKAIVSAWSSQRKLLWQSAHFFQLYVWMCLMFQKTTSESHRFSLEPNPQCTFTERILCSIVCLNVYNVSKKMVWKPLLLLEAHHSVYFYRAHNLFNCMFECV